MILAVPGTQVQVTFLPPPPQLYYPAQETGLTLASVNAGNSDGLWVGGGGLNKAFGELLSADDTGQHTAQYGPLHKALIAKADASGEVFDSYPAGNPVSFCYARTIKVTSAAGWYDGVCFLDVFGSAVVPHGNVKNAAMLYVAPPKDTNYADADAFLKAIGETAEHIVATVAAYNTNVAAQHQLPAIEALRMCLYSSGIYNRKLNVSRHRIARAIYAGLCTALQQGDSGLQEIQLPVPADPVFAAVQADLT